MRWDFFVHLVGSDQRWGIMLDPAISSRLCLTLLHSVWLVSLMALFAWIADRLVGRRAVERSYAIHVVALAASMLALPATYWIVAAQGVTPQRSVALTTEAGPVAESMSATTSPAPPEFSPVDETPPVMLVPVEPQGTDVASAPLPLNVERAEIWKTIAPWLAGLYLAGVVVMLARLTLGIWRAQRLGTGAEILRDGALVDLLRSLTKQWSMRIVPVLARAEQVVTPKVIGLVRPTILLPASAVSGLSTDELELILAHELAHVRRYDMWINLVQRLAEAILFFNPALWYLSRRISLLREYCCDEAVCGTGVDSGEPHLRYAQALLRAVEVAGVAPDKTELASLAATGRSPSELRRRVARLFGEPMADSLCISRSGIVLTTTLVLLLVAGPVVWQSAAETSPMDKAEVAKETASEGKSEDAETAPGDAEIPEQTTAPITVFGRALDQDGKPIARGEIFLASCRVDHKRLATTTTDADGRYRFEDVPLPIGPADTASHWDRGLFEVFGIAEGFGLSWLEKQSFYPDRKQVLDSTFGPEGEVRTGFGTEDAIELDLTFGPASTLHGRVVDDHGQPIADTELAIRRCERISIEDPLQPGFESLNEPDVVPERIKRRTTDKEGRFEFTGLPANRLFSIDVSPPGFTRRSVNAATKEGVEKDSQGNRVYSGDMEIVFARPRKVKFRVVYGDSGEPAEKVGISGVVSVAGFLETTDANGFAETLLPDGQYTIGLLPRYQTPYLRTRTEITVSEDTAKQLFTLKLAPAAIVDITVLDADSGKPLEGADVWLEQAPAGSATSYRAVHGYRSWEVETRISHYTSPRSDADGKMRVLFEPGKHRIGIGKEAYPEGFVPVEVDGKEIECRAGEPTSVEFRMKKQEAADANAGISYPLANMTPYGNDQVLARVGTEPVLASDIMPIVNERLSTLDSMKDALPDKIAEAQIQILPKVLPQYIETKQLYLDAKRRLSQEALEGVSRQLEDRFEETEIPSRLERLGLNTRDELEMQLWKWGSSIEQEQRAFVQKTIGQQWVLQELRKVAEEDRSDWTRNFIQRLREEHPVWTIFDNETPEPSTNRGPDTDGTEEPGDNTHETSANQFDLHVVDPDGKPIPAALVEIRTSPIPEANQILQGEFVKKSTYGSFAKADENGRLVVSLPGKPDRLNFSINTPGYGPYWADCHADYGSKTVPNEFTAQLDAGWSVGGVIVDEEGKPIEGVEVHPSVKYKKRPGANRELHIGQRYKTDAQGIWSFDCVPVSMDKVFVEIDHPDYMPKRQSLTRPEFGIEQGETPTASIALTRGLAVTGTVTDEAGKPIEGALLRTKFVNDIRQTRTDAEGLYTLVGCESRLAKIVVSATGRATDMQEVQIKPEMKPVDFQMQPGGKVRIRVLDENDNPIPRTRILFQRWRGWWERFEFGDGLHYTDENGAWEWNEAPLDEFQADICRPGGMQITRQKLIAREEEYVLRPPPALVITGTVVDADTKEPIKQFRALPGRQSAGGSIIWDRKEGAESTDGTYRVRRTYGCHAHLVRIEASGYLSTVSRQIKDDEGNVTINFELKKGQDVAATVLTPDGKPAAGADVALGNAGSEIMVKNGHIDDRQTRALRQKADDLGKFTFPAQGADYELVVTHPTGYAYIRATTGSARETIELIPWSRVEGTFRIGQNVAADIPLRLYTSVPDNWEPGSEGSNAQSVGFYYEVKTGAHGAYLFQRVIPGTGRIGRGVESMADSGSHEKMSSSMVAAKFLAGETLHLDLGGTGRAVIGKLEPPEGFTENVLWNFARLEVDLPRPPTPASWADAPSDPEAAETWWTEWLETEEGKVWSAADLRYNELRESKPSISATVGADGTFRIDDIPADKYTLKVRFSRESPGHLRDYRFEVPAAADSSPTDPIDLGILTLDAEP